MEEGNLDALVSTRCTAKTFRLRWIVENADAMPTNAAIKCDCLPADFEAVLYLKRTSQNIQLYLQGMKNCTIINYHAMFVSQKGEIYAKASNTALLYDDLILLECPKLMAVLSEFSNITFTVDCILILKDTFTFNHQDLLFTTNSKESCLKEFNSMFQSGLYSDVTFKVDGEVVPVHKSVLCARSPFFHQMFEKDMTESNENSIDIVDIKLPTLKRFLEFVYTGDFGEKDLNLQEVYNLYYASDKYLMDDLKKECGNLFLSRAQANNATQILIWADRHNDNPLKTSIVKFIYSIFHDIAKLDEWESFMNKEPKLTSEIFAYCTEVMKK